MQVRSHFMLLLILLIQLLWTEGGLVHGNIFFRFLTHLSIYTKHYIINITANVHGSAATSDPEE